MWQMQLYAAEHETYLAQGKAKLIIQLHPMPEFSYALNPTSKYAVVHN
jgi:hypothetical protein